ncbi:MFS transporter [Chelativorans salis]|uniref:MFS transporter n=1 Tax=Chelativorans salis TaxID=2978478 RepID=A0ABT2LS84_9HYPH|nr:MFS transporter [Chelativorans sp. EGI FJ00035]MCT7377391.1 MFS transporter [Chelativorans sp. EGI FJ00035]
MTVATTLVGDFFSGAARDRFMGLQAASIGVSGLFFLTGGGLLAEFHWRAPFLIYAIAFVVLPAILIFVPEPTRSSKAEAASSGKAPAVPVLTLPLAAVLSAAVLNSVVFYLMPTQLPFHLLSLAAAAPIFAGVALGATTLASAVVSLQYGRVRGRIGVAGVFAFGFALLAAGFGLVAAAESYAAILPAAVIVGFGLGMVMPNLGSAAMGLAPESHRGRVAGMLTACIFLGQFVSPLISQPLAAQVGYAAAFATGSLAILVAALVALAVAIGASRRRRIA